MHLRRIQCKFVGPPLMLSYLLTADTAASGQQVKPDLHWPLVLAGFGSPHVRMELQTQSTWNKMVQDANLTISSARYYSLISCADQSSLEDVIGVLALPLKAAFSCTPTNFCHND